MADEQDALDPTLGVKARHALHDEELIAAFAGGDLERGPELDRAAALVERCAACRDIHADLAVLRTALQSSGTAEEVGGRMPAPRDFRLSLETAQRIRPLSPIVRRSSRIAMTFFSFARPAGATLATLGLVGLLFGSIGMAGSIGFTAGPGSNGVDALATFGSGTGEIAGSPTSPGGGATPYVDSTTRQGEEDAGPLGMTSEGPSLPAIVTGASLVLLVGGLGMLVLAARRRTALAP